MLAQQRPHPFVDGATFKNVEFFTFEGENVRSVNVYFGATYEDGSLVKA